MVSNCQVSSIIQCNEASWRSVEGTCAQFVRSGGSIDKERLMGIADELITVYEVTSNNEAAVEAANTLALLATLYPAVIEQLIVSANHYERWLQIDDAFPYHPNAVDVLAMIRNRLDGMMASPATHTTVEPKH